MNPINHVAIIMDGNGRWGLKHKNSRNEGHTAGLKTVETIIKTTIKEKIPFLTLFAFSTENWKRPNLEINFLLNLLEKYLKIKINDFVKNDIKLKIIGQKKFSNKLNILLKKSENLTKKNSKLQVNLALNYGSKMEIVNAIKNIKKNKLKVSEENISKSLYTKNIPDPDFLIRTGGKQRLSNFLLWQISYSEIFFSEKLWPDFNERDYLKIISNFKKIQRNFGKI